MEEIKFRGKRLDNGEWVYGKNIQFQIDGTDRVCISEEGSQRWLDPETVGQFIGRKDRNGIDIYKDDLLKVWCLPFADAEEEMAKVTWDEKRAGFILLYNNGSYHYFYDVMEVEVVGNIHDTKLEDKK